MLCKLLLPLAVLREALVAIWLDRHVYRRLAPAVQDVDLHSLMQPTYFT